MRILLLILLSFSLLGAAAVLSPPASSIDTTPTTEAPLGLPPIIWPKDNPYSREKVELGRALFYDPRLSSDGTISCASCHELPSGFADKGPVSTGVEGRKGNRNSPSIINSAYLKKLFWDGRAGSLEEQCHGPLSNPLEMTLASSPHEALHDTCQRIGKIEGYKPLFKAAFGDENCSMDHISKAIATFERSVVSGNSRYDHYLAGDKTALTAQELEGWKVFNKSNCGGCHAGKLFTDGKFYNIGVGIDNPELDLGAYSITKNQKDWGSFKAPTLREVSRSAPYMHDGSMATLEEVVEYYNKGCTHNKNLDVLIRPLNLTEEEKAALVAYMKALNGEGWQWATPPAELPK